MRLRHLGVGLRQLLHQLERQRLVLGAGEQAVQLQEIIAAMVAFEQLLQIGQRFLLAFGSDQQAGERLQGLHRGRFGLIPDPGRVERGAGHARVQSDLDRALGDARIARVLGQISVGLRRQAKGAALTGNFRKQILVQHILGEFLLGQIRFGCGCGREAAGASACFGADCAPCPWVTAGAAAGAACCAG